VLQSLLKVDTCSKGASVFSFQVLCHYDQIDVKKWVCIYRRHAGPAWSVMEWSNKHAKNEVICDDLSRMLAQIVSHHSLIKYCIAHQ